MRECVYNKFANFGSVLLEARLLETARKTFFLISFQLLTLLFAMSLK